MDEYCKKLEEKLKKKGEEFEVTKKVALEKYGEKKKEYEGILERLKQKISDDQMLLNDQQQQIQSLQNKCAQFKNLLISEINALQNQMMQK